MDWSAMSPAELDPLQLMQRMAAFLDRIVLKPDEYSRTEIERGRRLVSPGEFDVWFAAPEDVILNKLRYYREGGSEKHLRDIASMLMIQGTAIDRSYIASWAARLDVLSEWQDLLASLEA